MTKPTCRADSLSVAEPLGGTAPSATQLLIVEQPGPWGSAAVRDSRMDPTVRRGLEQLEEARGIKVFLARRQDRKQLAGFRNVWFMQRIGRDVVPEHFRIAEGSPVPVPGASNPDTSLTNSETLGSVLFICTNGARDQCCAVAGRDLLRRLTTDVWEISHLGGHRFAPTALRFPDGLLFGRLDITSAGDLTRGRAAGLSHTRGRFGRDPWQQIAELSIAGETGIPLRELDGRGEPGSTTVSDGRGTTWTVRLSQRRLAPRKVSCKKQPTVDSVWMPTVVPSI